MNSAQILKVIETTIEENINNCLGDDYAMIKDVNIGDTLASIDCDKYGYGFFAYYFKLVEINKNIYIVVCKKDGTPLRTEEDIVNIYKPLNSLTPLKIRKLVMDYNLMPVNI